MDVTMRNAAGEVLVRMDFTFHPEMDQESSDWLVRHMGAALANLIESGLSNTSGLTDCSDCNPQEN